MVSWSGQSDVVKAFVALRMAIMTKSRHFVVVLTSSGVGSGAPSPAAARASISASFFCLISDWFVDEGVNVEWGLARKQPDMVQTFSIYSKALHLHSMCSQSSR